MTLRSPRLGVTDNEDVLDLSSLVGKRAGGPLRQMQPGPACHMRDQHARFPASPLESGERLLILSNVRMPEQAEAVLEFRTDLHSAHETLKRGGEIIALVRARPVRQEAFSPQLPQLDAIRVVHLLQWVTRRHPGVSL